MKQERDQFKSTMGRIIRQSHSDDVAHLGQITEKIGSGRRIVDDPHLYSEENVQRDLELLDDEICNLSGFCLS
jgi:hypothetical protein